MDASTVITTIIAVSGAALSTYLAVVARRAKAWVVKVQITNGFLTLHNGDFSDTMLFLTASNPGERPVVLQLPFIRVPNGNNLLLPIDNANVTFPHSLPESEKCMALVATREVAQSLREHGCSGKVKLVGVFRDALDTCYESAP